MGVGSVCTQPLCIYTYIYTYIFLRWDTIILIVIFINTLQTAIIILVAMITMFWTLKIVSPFRVFLVVLGNPWKSKNNNNNKQNKWPMRDTPPKPDWTVELEQSSPVIQIKRWVRNSRKNTECDKKHLKKSGAYSSQKVVNNNNNINNNHICNVTAEGFRFMPLGLVRLRTFRLSTWVS